MAIDTKLRTYGQNLEACLKILDKTYAEFAQDTHIPVTRLEKLKTGTVAMSISELETIARELNLLPLQLTKTYRAERREEELRVILSDEALVTSIPVKEETFRPTIRMHETILTKAVPKQAAARKPALAKTKRTVKPPVKTDIPQQERAEPAYVQPAPTINSTIRPVAKPKPIARVGVVSADETEQAFTITLDNISYSLREKLLRKEIADRIRFAKGSKTASQFVLLLQKKRTFSWLNTLGGVTPEELEDIAKHCSTTVRALITGEGIVALGSGEKASSWVARYSEVNPDAPSLEEAAKLLQKQLESFPPPIQFILAKYLVELV